MKPVPFIRDVCGLGLRDFQRDWLEELFREKNGERVYSEALWGLPRGNGKTEIAAAVALYMLCLDRPRAEVYIAAGSRDQASLAFKAGRRMVEASDELGDQVRVLPGYRKMEVEQSDSSLHVIAADAPLQHGLQPSCVIFDELWVQKKRDLFEALAGGLFKREGALLICISTAGFDPQSLLAQECRRGEEGSDPRFFYDWHSAPDDLPYDDPATWRIANPALADADPFMRIKGLEDDLRRMHEAEFRRWHLNQWTGAEDTWISADIWDTCDSAPLWQFSLPTTLGIDASIRRDATAVCTCQLQPDGFYHLGWRIWEPTPNKEVPLEAVMQYVREQAQAYNVIGACYDPQFLHHMAQRLDDEGIPMIEWKQDNARMVPATRTLHEAVVAGKVRHGGDPIARAHALNAGVKETERGLRIKKTASSGPDDAIVAAAMAVEWASRQDRPRRSVYEERFIS